MGGWGGAACFSENFVTALYYGQQWMMIMIDGFCLHLFQQYTETSL